MKRTVSKSKPSTSRSVKNDISKSYNISKNYNGQRYTGMQVGRSHKWYYDKGVWKETKVTPERWELSYHVTKRRAGRAPEGSGAAVGTAYHWFILSHQYVEKLNPNDYSTGMTGLKFKLAHRRAGQEKWSISDNAQRKALIKILEDFIHELEREPEKTVPIPLQFSYRNTAYRGVGIPVMSSCVDGVCEQVDVTLNKKHLGVLKKSKRGWRITDVPQGLSTAISKEVLKAYGAR